MRKIIPKIITYKITLVLDNNVIECLVRLDSEMFSYLDKCKNQSVLCSFGKIKLISLEKTTVILEINKHIYLEFIERLILKFPEIYIDNSIDPSIDNCIDNSVDTFAKKRIEETKDWRSDWLDENFKSKDVDQRYGCYCNI